MGAYLSFLFESQHFHMHISSLLSKFCSFLLAGSFLVQTESIAQNNGILPLSGIRYFNEGLWVKSIDVKIDGALLLSNRLPLNKEIEINLQQPAGFTEDNNRTTYAAAEFILVSPKGEILSKNPNLFLRNEKTGFTPKDFKVMSLKFGITAEVMKTNLAGIIKIRLYDLKGKNQLRLEFPVSIARPGEALQISKTVKPITSTEGTLGMINGLKAKNMLVFIDTSIKVSPKMAYTSLGISSIEGSSIAGIFQGKESFWVYDKDLNEIKITDILLKQVKGAMENDNVDYTLKIPTRLKTTKIKVYTVRFRWESPDKKQVIDVVTTI